MSEPLLAVRGLEKHFVVADTLARKLRRQPPDLVAPPTGCPFQPRCGLAREDCLEGDFPLRRLGPGRATACIHDDDCAQDVSANPVIASV